MQTTQQADQDQSIWRILPLHPQPQRFESLSGYMLRLAEANGLKSINELALLSGLRKGWGDVRIAPDYSSLLTGKLARIAGCSPENLRDMTFYHLARHFACPTSSREMSLFFQGSIARSLRYCPVCLAEQPYYRLCWRFLALAGCYKHGCSLLSVCGHCGAPIPLLPLSPHVACCAMCQGDLRICPTSPLPQQTIMHLERRTSDLEWLLMPAERAPEITSALLQGSGLLFLRQRKHLSLIEATHLMGRDRQVIAEMEEGNWGGQATLADYRRYTEILSCSLPDVIEAAHMMRSSEQGRRQRKLDGRARLVQTEVAQDLQRSLTERLQETSDPPRPLRRRIRASPS
ncbi:MAG TPA: TniQ family protein [Ktedonobacteraceae bacterium]|nr:TniQ family protein [Ktedonobacteraceae bacterium]